jgi:aminocarboxymuconate-semialdehyde decarboxylase
MRSRRNFITHAAAATAGLLFARRDLGAAGLRLIQAGGKRREVTIDGQRIRTVDIHTHCEIPEALDVLRGSPVVATVKRQLEARERWLAPERIAAMDAQGIDVQVLSINEYWHTLPRDQARDLIALQNETMSRWCAAHSDRFVALASVALQFPELAAEQVDAALKQPGMRGVAIGGSVEGEELSAPRFEPFWAKVEERGALVFMHPQPAPGITDNPRLKGKGVLDNIVGNPLETTVFLSHLIFEGTLDRHPGLRICGSHGGGYLASYSGRSDALCSRSTGIDCRNLKKRPSEYFKRELFSDTVVFDPDSLRHLVAACGAGQILYGSDYPFDWPVGIDFVLNAPFLTPMDKAAILGGNASRLLRL